jgi:hypothetical protein
VKDVRTTAKEMQERYSTKQRDELRATHPELADGVEKVVAKAEEAFGKVKVNIVPKEKRCPACGRKEIRSSEANRRYWALLHEIAEKVKPEGKEFSAETWHTFWKQKLLGSVEMNLPNGKTIQVPQTTTALDTSQFHDFATQVEAWANNRGVFLPE